MQIGGSLIDDVSASAESSALRKSGALDARSSGAPLPRKREAEAAALREVRIHTARSLPSLRIVFGQRTSAAAVRATSWASRPRRLSDSASGLWDAGWRLASTLPGYRDLISNALPTGKLIRFTGDILRKQGLDRLVVKNTAAALEALHTAATSLQPREPGR